MYTPCPLTNSDCWAGLHDPAEKKSLHKSWPLENSSKQEKAPAICHTCAAGRGDRAGTTTLQLPKPCHRAGPEGSGWSQNMGVQNSWQVPGAELLWMRGQAPGGRRKAQGCAFLGVRPRRPGRGGQGCAGLPPSYSWSIMQHMEGPGVPFPPQEGEGGSERACSLQYRVRPQ